MARKTAAQKAAEAASKNTGGSTGPADQTANQHKRKNAEDRPESVRAGRVDRTPNEDTGGRESIDGTQDRQWTNESKPVWGSDQPPLSELLKGAVASMGIDPVENPEQEEEEEEEEEEES